MKRLPAIMILLAVGGTAAVYFGVPYLRDLVETGPRHLASARMRIRTLADAVTGRPATQRELHENNADQTRKKIEAHEDIGTRIPALRNDPDAHDDAAPPVTNGYPAWGVIRERTRSFNQGGEFLRFLPGGVLLEIVNRHESSIGPLAESRVWFKQQWTEGIFLPVAALVSFDGTAKQAPKSKRETLCRYFSLRDALQRRRRELDGKLDPDHPLISEYRQARNEYEALRRRAKDLQSRRDRTAGESRIEKINKLAGMRRDIARAEKRLRRVAESVREMRESNQRAGPGSDKELARLQTELAALQPLVRKWIEDE